MDKTINYYAILGVLPTAEPVVIRAAYRALAMKYHPDKWIGDRTIAERRMREINAAFDIISNDQLRKQYDGNRKKREFEDYEFESDTAQEAFREAEQAQRSDWEVAVEYYPDLDELCAELRRTSNTLAFAFRATILETKQFSERKQIAERLEAKFIQTYFGHNANIVAFARMLIEGGHKAAAKELNRVISVLGKGADDHLVIWRIKNKFFEIDTGAARGTARQLQQTHYVSDAVALIEKMGGMIRPEKGTFVFGGDIVVSVMGETVRFKSEYDMAQLVINTIIPKVLSS